MDAGWWGKDAEWWGKDAGWWGVARGRAASDKQAGGGGPALAHCLARRELG